MLKIGNRDDREIGFEQSTSPAAGASSTTWPATPSEAARGETIIGEHISVEGTIRANENIIIEGRLKGTIEVKSHQLTVGPKGQVEADVEADSVVISGRMVGNITARNKVQVTKNADFNGQIKAKRIAVEDGAYIKASIELEREEKKQGAAGDKRPIDAMVYPTIDGGKTPKIDLPRATSAAK